MTLWFLLLLIYCIWILPSSASDNTNKIQEAIQICREKLAVDPHFPRVQHSLAQLLDSQIPEENPREALVNEVMELYHIVGNPPSQVDGNRLPPAKVRFESLVRAGTIAKDILYDATKAISFYIDALELNEIEGKALVTVFEMTIPLLLSMNEDRAKQEATISPRVEDVILESSASSQQTRIISLQNALNLCHRMSIKCPDEPIVDELTGAVLRKMKDSQQAYQSYHRAMTKSKQQYLNHLCREGNEEDDDCLSLLIDFVKTCILVAAASREAGMDTNHQMEYLTDAESHVRQWQEKRPKKYVGTNPASWNAIVIDLYNNMGIVEKKRGETDLARTNFRNALAVNPKDGHALVQLASLGRDDEIVSSVQGLDSEYVSALFDGYSSRFESELVDVLQYKGHSLVYEALIDSWKILPSSSVNRIVDLGCGTGLLGQLVARNLPEIQYLEGVDLSRRMTEIARRRGCYTKVTNQDAADYLHSSTTPNSVDCVLASDVFIYIGDISQILQESRHCLVEKSGRIGFTIEILPSSSRGGMKLLPSGRFGHSKLYIEEIANEYGFQISIWRDCILRKQGGKDVQGAVVILTKSS
jgi:predicted TPR repeat methyltransferase